jgi:hypothetical protein
LRERVGLGERFVLSCNPRVVLSLWRKGAASRRVRGAAFEEEREREGWRRDRREEEKGERRKRKDRTRERASESDRARERKRASERERACARA